VKDGPAVAADEWLAAAGELSDHSFVIRLGGEAAQRRRAGPVSSADGRKLLIGEPVRPGSTGKPGDVFWAVHDLTSFKVRLSRRWWLPLHRLGENVSGIINSRTWSGN
jgi:hypothetical protein